MLIVTVGQPIVWGNYTTNKRRESMAVMCVHTYKNTKKVYQERGYGNIGTLRTGGQNVYTFFFLAEFLSQGSSSFSSYPKRNKKMHTRYE